MSEHEKTLSCIPDSPDVDDAGDIAPHEHPQCIGRYRIERVLGKGGFGLVYLAHDEQLQRQVAIKIPHRKRVHRPQDAEAYLTEARTVANLDHPGIVPVFDVSGTEQFPCFIVSKYIDGADLATKLTQSRLSLHESVELVATVAEALHHAHKQGLVHRDVKPSNILLDKSGRPSVADFGLALREQDVGTGPRYAGTPDYMSPEQARGEGHRVDGRSDIFSLGIVFYELLTGRRPFTGDSQAKLLEQVNSVEVRPPRQVNDAIPKEIERICLKALSKRSSERYSTAKDVADDLRQFLTQQPSPMTSGSGPTSITPVPQPPSAPNVSGRFAASLASATTPTSDHQPLKIVPKGLRSFDAHDADFFVELLPGPRDRDGLPDSIRFWKTRIEETDTDSTFSVGLIYGPSGCGKSSLLKAGLLPRLSNEVIAVYVEATAEETETRVLNGLRKRFPALSNSLSLKETLASLRRGQGLPAGKKVLIVLDQFEQWLHAKKNEQNSELVQSLRQCDGGRVQCIVLVRDDFWLAVSRFLRELEIRLVDGQNSALADLFDDDHARKVLAAFGRAFGKLPENPSDTGKDQKEFLRQAVSGLSQGGKIICVRLALFAEMMKGKAWTAASLKEVGGTEGVGVTFLEETFSAATAPPEHRYHQKAARAVLRALLPESGTDIKGHMRSYPELLEASGYESRPRDFGDLIRILDSEIRLITPTDPDGKEELDESTSQAPPGQKYYQLTHDYLVPSLRDWLTRKQKETRRGRAELLLADRAGVWQARPENRQLPSLLQWFQIRWLTQTKTWTPPQRRMMAKAGRYHGSCGIAVVVLLIVLGWGGHEGHGNLKAHALRDRLLDASTAEVPAIVRDIGSYRRWVDPLLQDAAAHAEREKNARKLLHISLALLPVESWRVEYLYARLLDAEPHEVPVIRDALAPYKVDLMDKLWKVADQPEKGQEHQRLRAASALAKYAPNHQRWEQVQEAVGDDLVAVPAVYLAIWMDALRPVSAKLLSPLSAVYRDSSRRDLERSSATDILADYASDQPQILAELLMDSDETQFAVIYARFKGHAVRGLPILTGEIDRKLPADARDDVKEKLAKRQANAAVSLLRMNQPAKVWPLLAHRPDPRLRSYLIHRLSSLGADAQVIVKQLEVEKEITIRRALILSLGEYAEKDLSSDVYNACLSKLQEMYRQETDPGLHASAQWLLRQWKHEAWLKQVNQDWAKDKQHRAKRLDGIQQVLAKDKDKTPPQWYVNGQGQTMVVISGPREFVMGSPETEAGRHDEPQHKKRIGQTFAIAAKAVTVGEYRRFDKGFTFTERYAPTPDCPVVTTTWYESAEYCNWLSKQEGIPEDQWCYEIKGQAAKLKENCLSLSGYRLPTEAEVEYATRAGAVTSRYFGETEELLPRYAWYLKNSQERTWPVGSLKPNDLGLFDMQGNTYTWCHGSYKPYPNGKDEGAAMDQDDELVSNTVARVLRGGSYDDRASNVRSADRGINFPTERFLSNGFRLARTLPPGSLDAETAVIGGGSFLGHGSLFSKR